MKLWLVRHARPLVEPGICYGATDVVADPAATLQAASDLAAWLPAALPVRCSPLQRCTALARALQALRPDLAWQADRRLVEMNFGSWEGWRWDDIAQDRFKPWMAAFNDYRFGGSESVGELMARVASLRVDAGGDAAQEQVWITHAGVIRAASLLARGLTRVDRAGDWPCEVVDFGEFQSLVWRSDRPSR